MIKPSRAYHRRTTPKSCSSLLTSKKPLADSSDTFLTNPCVILTLAICGILLIAAAVTNMGLALFRL